MTIWSSDDGFIDVTSAFKGFSQPISELYDDIHRRGWTVSKLQIKDGQYVAEGKNPHGEKVEASGRTDATAVANLLVKVMRREHMRAGALRAKLGAWDHSFEGQLPEIAQAYQQAPVYDAKAASAWMDLAQDMGRRAQVIRQQLAVEYTDDPTPYATADEMREDVTQKKHIEVSRAFAHHPVWNEQQMLDYRLVADVLGHTIGGADWGWHGTCLAFASLAPLLSELPQKALFTELVGQTAFGSVYRQWGPQKIAFLDELIEKAQEEQNSPGHSGVHPSQSIVPGIIPRIGKTAMAERTGNPELDAAIAEFMMIHHDELGNIQDYRHPMVAWGQCEQVAEACAAFLRSKGFSADASSDHLEAFGYQNAQPSESVMTPQGPAGEFTYPEHCAVVIYNERGVVWWTIDFTAAQYGFVDEFPKVEPGPPGPLIGPQQQTTSAILQRTKDPNANWESGVPPLPDNAYMWQRLEGIDPLDSQTVTDSLRPLEPGLAKMHPEMAKQAVVNALRASLLGSRRNARSHAIHYQTTHPIPAHVDDPMAYWDAFEQGREAWNQGQGYAPHAHEQYWPEKKQFMQWVKALNPTLDDGDVQRLAKRELMHMLTEEEQRIIAGDPGEELTTEQLEDEAYEALRRRLKALTKPNVDQKVDFGNEHLFHEAATDPTLSFHEGIDPTTVLGNAQGYWGRWPTVYDPAQHTVHVGPEGSTHSQVMNELSDPRAALVSRWQGWIGHNPESNSGLDPSSRKIGQYEVGWYNGSPGPEVDYALGTREWPRHPNSDAEDEGGYGHAYRLAMAADPYWLEHHIQRNGPYMWHRLNDITHRDSVLNEGLRPWNQMPGFRPRFDKDLEPRPDHVYMRGSRNHSEFDEHRDPQMVRVDLRKLNPENLTADEDSMNNYAEHLWGVKRNPRPGQSRGELAEELHWGDQPSQTAWSVENINALAHRGVIPPEAIDYPYDPEHIFEPAGPPPDFKGKIGTHHADMYPPYMHSHLRPLAQISRNATALADAAREDLLNHKGHGHHFRATALSLGIPEVGPRQASNAWLHLAPQTSQLGILNPGVMEMLGHGWEDMSPRDYFKFERELGAGRDAAGYNHVPLGAFSTGLSDLYHGGPGWHPDRSALKAVSPTPHHTIDWTSSAPTYPGWNDDYWWASTQDARDQAATDFDRNIAIEHSKSEIPFRTSGYADNPEWIEEPEPEPRNVMKFYPSDKIGCPACNPKGQARIEYIKDISDCRTCGGRGFIASPIFKGTDGVAFEPQLRGTPVHDTEGWGPRHEGASAARPYPSPWVTHPVTGERLTGAPGTSLMQHLKDTLGHPDVHSVWAQDYEAGKS